MPYVAPGPLACACRGGRFRSLLAAKRLPRRFACSAGIEGRLNPCVRWTMENATLVSACAHAPQRRRPPQRAGTRAAGRSTHTSTFLVTDTSDSAEAGVIVAGAGAFVLMLLHTLGKASLVPTHDPGY